MWQKAISAVSGGGSVPTFDRHQITNGSTQTIPIKTGSVSIVANHGEIYMAGFRFYVINGVVQDVTNYNNIAVYSYTDNVLTVSTTFGSTYGQDLETMIYE